MTQMAHRYDDDPPIHTHNFFLQIYMIQVNGLFQGENGKFRRKVTSLHPCVTVIHKCAAQILLA